MECGLRSQGKLNVSSFVSVSTLFHCVSLSVTYIAEEAGTQVFSITNRVQGNDYVFLLGLLLTGLPYEFVICYFQRTLLSPSLVNKNSFINLGMSGMILLAPCSVSSFVSTHGFISYPNVTITVFPSSIAFLVFF